MRQLALAALVSAALAFAGGVPSARAWYPGGHRITAAVAHAVLLQDNPKALARTAALLRQHPDYERFWKADVEAAPAAEQDLRLLMRAACWPDEVRGREEYDRPSWHFINVPFRPYDPDEAVARLAPTAPAPLAGDTILRAYALNLDRLRTAQTPADRAVALCWVLHLVGDVHQPLHTTQLFSEQFPDGDRGGTRFWVRAGPGERPISLHHFWDGLLPGNAFPREASHAAAELRRRPELARDRLTELKDASFDRWAREESFRLARDVAYLGGKLPGSADPDRAPALPDGYARQAKAIAERRILLAGYRLADVLARAYE